jgi:DeoR/GlpR family transcriptional regulator of sugar metabolism
MEKIYFASLNCLKNIHYLITDENIPDEYVKKLKDMGITVIV